jgi:hypothetical protein
LISRPVTLVELAITNLVGNRLIGTLATPFFLDIFGFQRDDLGRRTADGRLAGVSQSRLCKGAIRPTNIRFSNRSALRLAGSDERASSKIIRAGPWPVRTRAKAGHYRTTRISRVSDGTMRAHVERSRGRASHCCRAARRVAATSRAWGQPLRRVCEP